LPHSGKAVRLGITGVPGVGKSTFIESLGMFLIRQGRRVAVLAVDPSSSRSGGSIMADKTRMEQLAVQADAYIRPSPSGGTLGGVARKTRETMIACEAAGFDVMIVETVGVGQSETTVASMVDFFLVLMLAGAGDELQGIKKGVLELADAIAITKADGDNVDKALKARQAYEYALHLLAPASPAWHPPVLTCSARAMEGVDRIWETVLAHRQIVETSGALMPTVVSRPWPGCRIWWTTACGNVFCGIPEYGSICRSINGRSSMGAPRRPPRRRRSFFCLTTRNHSRI
jgi:LAO/AO transport system kinase